MKRPARGKQPQRSLDEGALVRRFAGALPLPSAGARKAVSAWLSGIARKTSGKAFKSLVEEDQALARILAGIAETAPYLWDLLQADLSRTTRLLTHDPEDELAALLGATRTAAAAASGREPLMRILRRMKAEAALLIALADIGGAWPLARITHALTDVAETALGAAARFLLAEAADRGKLLPVDPQHLETGCGYIVLAMGKMGAHELNFSSDIDLMVFFDPRAPARAANIEPASLYVRLTRDLVKLLQERTADGYVFRVDLRLRPDPSSTQIAISREAALEYYESRGQNWERAALIKARPCAGDLAAGERLLHDLSPFVWRKYLDYATVADVHAMKQQIHAYRGHGEIAVEGHNIKLGRGGIREIEFFVQTQQLIAGGRHAELRGRETVATLGALAVGGWIDAATRDELTAAYEFLRRVEHRLQMIADEQTHTLPADSAALDQFARFLGFPGRDDFAETLLGHLRAVERHYVRLFEGAREVLARQQNLSFATPEGERDTLDRLAQMGFRQPREVAGAVYRWRDAAYRALRGEQARANLIELVPVIIDQFARAENPDAALVAFDRFLAGLRAGGRFLSLLRQHPDVIRFIALILGAAPRLAEILAQHPHVIDPLIDPRFFGMLPDEGRLEAELARALAETRSYEEMLDAIRRFGQEHMFLIGARILSGSVSAEQAGEVFARLADVLIRALRARVVDDFAAIHGRLPGEQTAILALGRLGAREMTATSDLDLIVIYDFDAEHPNSDGKRPLYGAQYFARLTQRLISALTVRTNYGVLYPGRHAVAAVRTLWTAGDANRRLYQLSGTRGLDLGTHGAHARPDCLRTAGFLRAHRSRNPRGPLPHARRARDRGGCPGNARRDRQGKGRRRPLGPQICGGRAGRYRVHRAISATRARRRDTGNPRHLDRAHAGEGGTPRRARARGRLRCCGPRCGSITTSRRFFGFACRDHSIRQRRAPVFSACWPGPPICRISRRCRRMSRKRSVRCANVSCGFWGRRLSRERRLRGFFFAGGGSTGPPALRQAPNPPLICPTGRSPMRCAVCAASAERQPPAQKNKKRLSSPKTFL